MNTGTGRFLFYKQKQKKPIDTSGGKKSKGVNMQIWVGVGARTPGGETQSQIPERALLLCEMKAC